MKMGPHAHDFVDAPSGATPTFTAKNGAVFYRGVYLYHDNAVGLLKQFEASARDRSDYFHTHAKELAAELRAVLAEVYPQEIAA